MLQRLGKWLLFNVNMKKISFSFSFISQQKVQCKRGKSEDENVRSFKAGNVLIYDVESLMPFSKDLGASYVWV